MQTILEKLNKFFGAVIALNIFHQIISSAGYLTIDMPLLQILYSLSIGLFAIEFFIRAFVERRASFLLLIDGMVLMNQVFFSIYDLRILRLFRLFDIFSQSRFLLPTNTLIKTIIKQRNALLGSQIMVISILLVVSTFIYFLVLYKFPFKTLIDIKAMTHNKNATTISITLNAVNPIARLKKIKLLSNRLLLGMV